MIGPTTPIAAMDAKSGGQSTKRNDTSIPWSVKVAIGHL